MKETSVIVNIARGSIINERELFSFLKNNKIGGAVIDTWFKYPADKSEKQFKPSAFDFNKLNNVVMTPHISAWSEEMLVRRSNLISSNIEKLYLKKSLINQLKL